MRRWQTLPFGGGGSPRQFFSEENQHNQAGPRLNLKLGHRGRISESQFEHPAPLTPPLCRASLARQIIGQHSLERRVEGLVLPHKRYSDQSIPFLVNKSTNKWINKEISLSPQNMEQMEETRAKWAGTECLWSISKIYLIMCGRTNHDFRRWELIIDHIVILFFRFNRCALTRLG